MKILITGATGACGGALTRYFAERNHEIIACGRMKTPPTNLAKIATYYQADIQKEHKLPEADVCIHTAAFADDKATERDMYIPNVVGTENVAKATANFKKFIHISSSSVYLPENNPIPENLAGQQNNSMLSPYGKTKLEAEKKLQAINNHEACFILRPRAFYGVGDCVILPRLFKLVKNNKLQYPGKMEISISMTHYHNLAQAIECCLNSEKTGTHIYNVADSQSYLLIEVMRELTSAIYKTQLPEKQIPLALLKFMALFKIGGITPLLVRSFTKNMVLDITKITKELNYSPKINLTSQMPELLLWIEKIGGIEVLKKGEHQLAWA